jgi:putative nucleotidyltransferase with HDIG domain
MTDRDREDAVSWLRRAPQVPGHWFRRASHLHGVSHTQRVHIHAQRLSGRLGWPRADRELVLCAALWHDIGREGDGVEPSHGLAGVARADELGLPAGLSGRDAALVRFAIERHSLPDGGAARHAAELAAAADPARRLAEPERALRILWLLKDADALDRVRLGFGERADPRQLRHPQSIELIGFAEALCEAHH